MEIEIRETFPVIQIMTDISEIKNTIHHEDYKDEQTESNKDAFHRSNNSSRKKSFLHPIYGNNPYAPRANYSSYHCTNSNPNSNVSKFTQRVMSAKLLRSKQLQNQLTEAQTQINELSNENRMLKALYRRQDIALKKYEGSQEQLPQLMKSHSEEIRILSYKYKQLRVNYRDLENKLKQRDSEILVLKERNLHLTKLSKDKHLWDREKLTRKLEAMEITVKEQQHKIQMLNRKLELESKGYKHNLNLEVNKLKEVKEELKAAQATIDSLRRSFEGKQNYVFIPQKLKRTPQNSQLSYSSRNFVKKNEEKSGATDKLVKGSVDAGTDSSMSLVPESGGQKNKQAEACVGEEQESIEEKETPNNPSGLRHFKNRNFLKFHGQDSIKMSLNSGNNYGINESQIVLAKGGEVKGVVSMNRTFHFQKKRNSELMNWISQEEEKTDHSTPANVSFYKKKWKVTSSQNEDHSSDGLSDDDIDEDMNNSGKSLEHNDSSDQEWVNEKSDRKPHTFMTNNFRNEETGKQLQYEREKEKEDLGKVVETKDSTPIDENLSEKCVNGKLHLKEVEDNIERLVEEACRGMEFEDSDAELKEFEKFEAMTWEEFKEEGSQLALIKEKNLKDLRSDLSETNEEKLEEERKANLLKALEDIDKEEKLAVRKDFINCQDGSIEGVQAKVVTADVLFSSIFEKIKIEDEGYPTPSQVEKKRKTNIIQELFGDSNCISTSK